MIISVSGYAGSGKDTVGKIIQYLTTYPSSENKTDGINRSFNSFLIDVGLGFEPEWKIKKWATALRKVAAILLGMDEEFLYTEEFKNMVLPQCWSKTYERYKRPSDTIPMTGREFLQKLGTDAIRNGLHENTWVNALISEYNPTGFDYQDCIDKEIIGNWKYPNWIITDTRFPNELAAVKERSGITIRVNRPIYVSSQQNNTQLLHSSETALDHITDWDFAIENNGTMEELIEQVRNVLIKVKVL